MRTNKFRAWDERNKRMIYLGEGDIWNIWEFVGKIQWSLTNHIYKEETVIDYQNGILMQFTGLHDKNGKEIWEGDIVKEWECDCENCRRGKTEPLKVKIIGDIEFTPFGCQDAGWHLHWKNKLGGGSAKLLQLDDENLYEVIGNIMENENLLK